MSKYSDANKAIIEGKIASAKEAVAALTSVEQINAKLQEVKAEIDLIPTMLKEAQDAAIAEIEGHITDKDDYSQNGLAQIDRIIADAKENINKASDTELIASIVEDAKSELDKVLTIQGEKEAAVLELKNSMTTFVGEVVEKYTSVEGTDIVIDTADQNSTILYFGTQDGNTATVFDTYLTINYRSTEWSSVSIRFRAWDNSTCYIVDVKDNSLVFKKDRWDTEIGDKASTVIINDSNGIKHNEKVHLQIICWGWTKKVLIDGECVFSIVENSYNGGRIWIETWQAGVTLGDPMYIEYATDADLEAVWSAELAKTCVNKTEQEKLDEAKNSAKSVIASYVESDKYSAENQVIISGIIAACNTAIDNCTSIEAVEAAVDAAKAQLDAIYTIEQEEALATAKTTAKSTIANHLSDVETAYSTENQAKIADIIEKGNGAIDECGSIAEVDAAVAQIQKQLNAVYTLEQEADGELLEKKAAAKTAIATYLSDVESKYSAENQAEIAKIISDGESTIDGCQDGDTLEAAVADIKKDLDDVLTLEQQALAAQTARAQTFLDSLSGVWDDQKLLNAASVTDGKLVFDSKKANFGGDVQFGNQEGNMNKAFDTYITIDYNSIEWSYVTIRFCAWDTNTCLKMEIRDNGIKIIKSEWSDSASGAVETLLVESNKGIKNGQEAHLQIITQGWTKMVVVGGECIFKCWPNAYHVGYTMIGTWECGVTLRDPVYTEYGSDNEVTADYGDVLKLSSGNETELNGKF